MAAIRLGGVMLFLESIFWLAMNIYHEARGEQLAGQVAVGHVVLNRAERQGKPVKDIVLAPYQFSWANGDARPSVSDYDSCAHASRNACGSVSSASSSAASFFQCATSWTMAASEAR